MIKQLFFTAALLVPGLAYGGNPSADLSGQIVPAEQDPTPPPQAAAAGFTTLAANFDWANGQLCVGTNCVAASPASNWLDCTGNDATRFWHGGYWTLLPCNAGLAVDPATGQNSLFVKYLGSYAALQANGVVIITQTSDGTLTMSWPQGAYTEAAYRIDTTYPGGLSQSGPHGPFWWQQSPCVIDFQLGELYGSKSGFGSGDSANWCPPGGGRQGQFTWQNYAENSLPTDWSPTAIHKYGALRTTNGVDSYMECSYVDDILQIGSGGGCFDNYPSTNPDIAGARSFMIIVGTGVDNQTVDTTLWMPWMRVWTCANGATGQCNGTTLAQPGGGLQYWH
jgi:hypothetical protein